MPTTAWSSKNVLSTRPEDSPINELVGAARQRWHIERDYQDLKQDFGLGHYEGRGWRAFHHHASLSIAAYAFLMAERLIADKPVGGKGNALPQLWRQPCLARIQPLHRMIATRFRHAHFVAEVRAMTSAKTAPRLPRHPRKILSSCS